MGDYESAKGLMEEIAEDLRPWEAALRGETRDVSLSPGEALTELKALLKKCPQPLPRIGVAPNALEPTPRKAALHYALANVAIRTYSHAQERPPNLSRGMLLDFWDAWWLAASGLPPDEASRRVTEHMRSNDLSERWVVWPSIVGAAFCSCDRDLAAIIVGPNGGIGGDEALSTQIFWQIRRLHAAADAPLGMRAPFSVEDRAVLYHLLFMRHLRFADEGGFVQRDLQILIAAVRQTQEALEQGGTTLPTASETVFSREENGAAENEKTLALAAMQFVASADQGDMGLRQATAAAISVASALNILTPDENKNKEEQATRLWRLILRLTARSRMIRLGVEDLLDYRFPKPNRQAVGKIPTENICDCWISVVGRRKTGKSYFMASLAASLLPEKARFDDQVFANLAASLLPEQKEQKTQTILKVKEFWTKGRVRLLESDAFQKEAGRKSVEAKAFEADTVLQLLQGWCAGADVERTLEDFGHLAEIDTPEMARMRFFDFAGEQIIRPDSNALGEEVRDALKAIKPTAAVIIDSDEEEVNKAHLKADYQAFAQLIASKNAPIYIVINKADLILADARRSDEARKELGKSMEARDAPDVCDADFGQGWSSIFTLRDVVLDPLLPPFEALLRHIDEAPFLARRPYFQHRLRHDVNRLSNLITALLANGRQDLSFLYLVAARNGRIAPSQFLGHQTLWRDLEERVLTGTAESRRSAIRRLLVEDLVAGEHAATEAYGSMDPAFKETLPKLKPLSEAREIAKSSALGQEQAMRIWEAFSQQLVNSKDQRAANLHVVWRWISNLVAARRAMVKELEDITLALLPEVGVKPKDSFAGRHFDEPIDDQWRDQKIDEVIKKIGATLKDDGFFFDDLTPHIGRLVREVVRGSKTPQRSDDQDANAKKSKTEIRYNLLKGAERPLGVAGSPVRDNQLNQNERKALAKADGEFGTAILAAKFSPEEGVALAQALRNISAHGAPYSHLILSVGERDFHKARVLTEKSEIGGDLMKFNADAFQLLEQILTARRTLRLLNEDVAVNLAMATALLAACPMVEESLEQLVEKTDEASYLNLQQLTKQAETLRDKIDALQSQASSAIFSMKNFNGRLADAYADLYAGDGNAKIWRRLLPTSYEAVRTRRDAPEIGGVAQEIDLVAKFLVTLQTTVASLRLVEPTQLSRAEVFVNDPTFFAKQGDDIGDRLSRLKPRLVRLRLMRRALLVNYALRLLQMGGWLEPVGEFNDEGSRGGKALLTSAHRQLLSNVLPSLTQRFQADFQEHADLRYEGLIGTPANDAFAVEGEGEAVHIKDAEYMKLLELLGVAYGSPADHPLWRGRS